MSPRPLRQFYGHDRRFVLDGLTPPAEPFRRHRGRFLEALQRLSQDEWAAKTRCDAWDAKDVVNHLVVADGFWALTLSGRGQPEPTTYLRGFHPNTSPDTLITNLRGRTTAEALDALAASTEQLGDALASVPQDEWSLVSESPLGHMPAGAIASHSLWDSWLHERDILLPLGHTPPIEDDELLNATAFTLFIGGAQGGVLDDDEAVGDGPDAPITATLAFSDLPDRAVRVCIDRDVSIEVDSAGSVDSPDATVSALDLVEGFSGRTPAELALDPLPADVAAQLARARTIL